MKLRLTWAALLTLTFLTSVTSRAQFGSFLGGGNKMGPTDITADNIDIELKKNLITLTGNVEVNEKAVDLTADQVFIILTDKDKAQQGGEKRPKSITAQGNVVIIRKPQNEEERAQGARKVTAGKAVYNLDTGIIRLTENPMLSQGKSWIKAPVITIYRDNDRVTFEKLPGQKTTPKLHVDADTKSKGVK